MDCDYYIPERQVLAGILIDSSRLLVAKKMLLDSEKFHDSVYRVLMRAIETLDEKGYDINFITVFDEIDRTHNQKSKVKKIEKHDINFIADQFISDANFEYYVERVLKNSIIRKYGSIEKLENQFDALNEDRLLLQRSAGTAKTGVDFPEIVYDGAAGKFAEVHSKNFESPKQFFFMAYLTFLGSVIADNVKIKQSGLLIQPRLYCIILAESAATRKTTAIELTKNFFKNSVQNFAFCEGINSAEGLVKQLRQKNKLILLFDEFKTFVGKTKVDGSVLLPAVCSFFDKNSYESTTKKENFRIENAFISLLAASTVETYNRIWSSEFTAIGFNNRVFIITGIGQRKNAFPVKIDHHDEMELKSDLGSILGIVGNNLELEFEKDAREFYNDWYKNKESSIYYNRLDTYAMRFAQLFAINEKKTVIDIDIIKKAVVLVDWQYVIRSLYDPTDADTLIGRMEQNIIKCIMRGKCTDRELKQYTNASKFGFGLFEQAKQNLIKSKEISYVNKRYQILQSSLEI